MKFVTTLLASFISLTISVAQFDTERVIAECDDCSYIDIVTADFDGDEDIDLLAGTNPGNQIIWFENVDGQEMFTPHLITDQVDKLGEVAVSDIDDDGDIDVLSASIKDNKVAWYENDGSGVFSQQKVISESLVNATEVLASDLDGDGDNDIIVGYFLDNNRFSWFENLGDQTFADELLINNNNLGSQSDIATHDIDNDGDQDIILSVYLESTHKLLWQENDGQGGFSDEKLINTNTIPTWGETDVIPTDLNGDDQVDILFGFTYHQDIMTDFNKDFLQWVDMGETNELERTPQTVVSSIDLFSISDIRTADLDADGDNDVIYSSLTGPDDGVIGWSMNDGKGNFSPTNLISKDLVWPTSITTSDIDGDGDLDVITEYGRDAKTFSGAINKIVWYPNDIASVKTATLEVTTPVIKVFPNPTTSLVTIELDKSYEYHVSLTDETGRLILQKDNTSEINLGELTDGLYFLTVTNTTSQERTTKTIYVVN